MKQRIITALILITLSLPVLIIRGILLDLYILLIFTIGTFEITKIFKGWPSFVKYSIIFISLFVYASLLFFNKYTSILLTILVLCVLLLPVFLRNVSIDQIGVVMLFVIISLFAINGYISLQKIHHNGILCLVITTCITDAGAYFVGSKLGKHKLCPEVSPKKTIEGSVGGFIIGVLFGALAFYLLTDASFAFYFPITIAISIIGQFGDLVFSAIKRHYGIKDYSNLLPGHGGILDRFDSTIFSLIGVYLILLLI